jgi:hypothetical protein
MTTLFVEKKYLRFTPVDSLNHLSFSESTILIKSSRFILINGLDLLSFS